MKFKVGDRVRINCPTSERHGMTGTIYSKGNGDWADDSINHGSNIMGWRVNIDGIGKVRFDGCTFAYLDHQLIPLTNPDTEAWKAFKELLKPNPAILAARDPAKKQEFWVTP